MIRRVMHTLSRRRRVLVWTLVVVASLIAFAAILTTWVNRQMLSQRSWQNASAELIQDPAVQSRLSVYLVNSLYDSVNVGDALGERLPANLKPLAGTVAGALRQPLTDATQRLLEAPRA